MKKYAIREVFSTLQGEGAQAGTPALFLRFAGCNLGYEVCPWCDTDWAKAQWTLTLEDAVDLIRDRTLEAFGRIVPGLLLVATGGEPSLQVDHSLVAALRDLGFRISMESNGARRVDRALVDWLTISPKEGVFAQKEGNELKIIFSGASAPGPAPDIDAVRRLAAGTRFDHYFLQAVDLSTTGPNYAEAVAAVMALGPPWRLSVQTHKILRIP